MNECFLIGKIIRSVQYEFLINRKESAIAIFTIELDNKSKIILKGYDRIADFCYQQLKKGDKVFLEGNLLDGEIRIRRISKFIH